MRIDPTNLTAQLHYRPDGNPPSSLPESAISNAFPGLEFDFRNVWRRLFEGIELHEADNYVVAASGEHARLKGRRLLRVAGEPTVVPVSGPQRPHEDPPGRLTSAGNPDGVVTMEWSNSLAAVLKEYAGRAVKCEFTKAEAPLPVGLPAKEDEADRLEVVDLVVRPLFAFSAVAGGPLPVIDREMVQPGELTRGLCSPWQNDYRECACYYWAASRPDFVNTEVDAAGTTVGNSWLAVDREPKEYVLDDREDSRLLSYEDLFQDWQRHLRFIVDGQDHVPGDGQDHGRDHGRRHD
ncbi:hypothetical protein AB0D08_10165 [Kitasatospora sp. NPDC048540]|uniref:hypothetical protein n=1 Tax=Kitasatospora sp. NPDC048540 TaxID=3155634 RepID=UPI0033C6E374